MGATLPVLMHALRGGPETFGMKLGFVYGANTLGAVIGTLGAELLLVPAIGVLASGVAAASLNLVAAMLAQRASRSEAPRKTAARPKAAVTKEPELVIGRWPLLIAGGLSGALFLGFEVATFRFLLLFFTALNVNFAVMLAVMLCGLALGGFAWSSWFRSTTTNRNRNRGHHVRGHRGTRVVVPSVSLGARRGLDPFSVGCHCRRDRRVCSSVVGALRVSICRNRSRH